MKKAKINRSVYNQAKSLLNLGKTQAKVAKKLKIGTGTVSKIKNTKNYSAYSHVPRKVVTVISIPRKSVLPNVGIDRNFSLDKDTVTTQAKRIGELSVENGELRDKLSFMEKTIKYKEEYWQRFDSITGNLAKIIKVVGFTVGFIVAMIFVTRSFRF